MMSIDQIVTEIEKNSGLTKDQIMEKISQKQEELGGLVSLEGSAHLMARELGIDIVKEFKRSLKIKDLVPGMKNITLKAKVIDKSETREFQKKDGSVGHVANLILSDGTGQVRLPLWDKQTEIPIETGGVISLQNIYSRQNIFGGVELSLSKYSKVEKLEGEEMPVEPEPVQTLYDRMNIVNAKEGFSEIRGIIVDVFNINPVFSICPECKQKTDGECKEHKNAKPEDHMIISGILDDGTGSMRAVFFREVGEEISGLAPKSLKSLEQSEAIKIIKENVLGKDIIVKGRIRKNKMFENLELVANSVEEVDPLKESRRLINEIKSMG